jgi:ketosteroid isomerase-like protein
MSQENVKLVRTWFEAFQRRDREGVERVFDFFDAEIEWDASRFNIVPDLTGVYRGHEAIRAFWRRWLSSWQDLHFEIEDMRDADDQVVVLIRNQRQWGRYSGIATESPPYGWVYTFRGNKVVRVGLYSDQESALEAAGSE